MLNAHLRVINAYLTAQQVEKAIQFLGQSIEGSRQARGAEHPITLILRNNLAVAYRAAGQLDDAIKLFEQTFADSERALGPNHHITSAVREHLTETLRMSRENGAEGGTLAWSQEMTQGAGGLSCGT